MVILTTFPPPTEGVRHREDNTQALMQSQDLGKGTLFIAESRVSWRGTAGQGFSLEYPAITLHAISRDLSAFPHPCLYLMLDTDVLGAQGLPNHNSNSESSGEEDDEQKISEIRFVPDNPESLDALYKTMSDCQVLHPDQKDSPYEDEDGDDEEGYFEGEEGADHLSPEGQATLSRFEAMLDPGDDGIGGDEPQIGARQNGEAPTDEPMDTAQFDDAD